MFYPAAGVLAAVFSRQAAGIEATAEASNGGVDNSILLDVGRQALALPASDVIADGAEGKLRGLPTKLAVRALAALFDSASHVACRIARLLYKRAMEIDGVHKAFEQGDVRSAVAGIAMPFHPGAVRFYREKGAM